MYIFIRSHCDPLDGSQLILWSLSLGCLQWRILAGSLFSSGCNDDQPGGGKLNSNYFPIVSTVSNANSFLSVNILCTSSLIPTQSSLLHPKTNHPSSKPLINGSLRCPETHCHREATPPSGTRNAVPWVRVLTTAGLIQ